MKLSLLITFYNEEKMIEKTHAAMSEQLQRMLGQELDDYELLYIDDGSKDRTFAIVEGLANSDERVRYISLSRNFGREGGILAGFKYATGDAVMVMDGDLQHPPYLIPQFLAAYKEGYDIVSGQRDREGESKLASLFARLFYDLSNHSMDVKLTDGKSELRLLSRRAVDTFLALQSTIALIRDSMSGSALRKRSSSIRTMFGRLERVSLALKNPSTTLFRESFPSMISPCGFVFNLDFSAWALPSFTYYLNFTSILPIQVTMSVVTLPPSRLSSSLAESS